MLKEIMDLIPRKDLGWVLQGIEFKSKVEGVSLRATLSMDGTWRITGAHSKSSKEIFYESALTVDEAERLLQGYM